MLDIQKVSLKDYTSLRIGGEADLVCIGTEDSLCEAHTYAMSRGLHMHILGLGTNSFFKDALLQKLILKMEIQGLDSRMENDKVFVTIGAGVIWDDVVTYAVTNGYWGIENLSYIPGTVGAAPVQNIGAYGMELKDTLVSVRVYDTTTLDFKELSNEECHFGYRDSVFKNEKGRYVVTAITLKLSTISQPVLTYKPLDALVNKELITLTEIRDVVIKTRTQKLPDYNVYPNAGSFFKNTIITKEEGERLRVMYENIPLHETNGGYKVPTAWMIENVAEMKGVRVQDIGTWPLQPLVLVNYGSATFEDILAFSSMIVRRIEEKTGIYIEREVNFVE